MLNISNFSMMPEWQHSYSSKLMPILQESKEKKIYSIRYFLVQPKSATFLLDYCAFFTIQVAQHVMTLADDKLLSNPAEQPRTVQRRVVHMEHSVSIIMERQRAVVPVNFLVS